MGFGHCLAKGTHFHVDLDCHLIIEVNIGFDFQFQTHVQVLHATGHYRCPCRNRCHGIGYNRDAVADHDLGFFAIASPDARAGQNIGFRILQHQIKCYPRRRAGGNGV